MKAGGIGLLYELERPSPCAQALLRWYDNHARQLPWRIRAPNKADPYHIWLSEVMLQQTTVATVKGYYADFLKRWPKVQDLAAAPEGDVMAAWAGLGYYARARNLHACAKEVVTKYDGHFPANEEGLRALPGIGPYTAAAVAAIAFDIPAVVVDGNIERIISRLYAIETALPASRPEIREKGGLITPQLRAGDFAQGMMDLGAMICTPQKPACGLCPFEVACIAKAQGEPTRYPVKAEKKPRPERQGIVFYARRMDGKVLTRIRPKKGLLGGMMEFPSIGWEASSPKWEGDAPLPGEWQEIGGQVVHVFTHFKLHLEVRFAQIATDIPPLDGFDWTDEVDLETSALPTLMKKVMKKV